MSEEISGYGYSHANCGCAHRYLLPNVSYELSRLEYDEKRVFDLGCGNGSVANWMATQGYSVHGVDPSVSGIEQATKHFPTLDLRVGSAYDDLKSTFGSFPLVVSFEVVEHVYAPREYAKCVFDLLSPGGHALISTPYHGYLKNLVMAVSGKMDAHFTAMWDNGHIKFWSRKTIALLLNEAGFKVERIHRVGRIPQLAKSMLIVARKPT